ncbi:PepSY-associated TM helix domain-containing protein [Arsukibacterium sp.]|uniref:PepSY-associated TM helix domain-containing protein n=1 Tax=Arsukibacterium sp. TaxID=1977258 RepID=UPI00299E4A4F|nr:PepSY-associated TM helix domain-containing protein [Arsukibacterium sp.]MDX1677422.1 PepSY-associated TM helix domain-containing protein [Arsukibacterium sp.]
MVKFSRRLHNWLGLILVAQITLWFLSGLVMAVLPIEQVRGEHLRLTLSTPWQQAAVSPQQVLKQHGPQASLSLSQRLNWQHNQLSTIPVYLVNDAGRLYRYNAATGDALSPLTEQDIRALAKAQYQGNGQLQTARLLQQLPQEVQHLTAPLWQLQFADSDNSHFYLDPATGEVLRVRTDSWRWFDFFWMLHIMDYQDRSNFNNPLLITFSASALLFTLSGIVLLWQRFRPRKYRKTSAAKADTAPT